MALAQQNPSSGGVISPSTGGVINPGSSFEFKNPLSVGSICGLLKMILEVALVLGIPIMVLALVYSGFLFVMARGSETGLTKAKANFMWTVIGIALFLGAWTLGNVVAATINQFPSDGKINTQCK